MASGSLPSSSRSKRDLKMILKRLLDEAEKTESEAKRQSTSPKSNASSTASSSVTSFSTAPATAPFTAPSSSSSAEDATDLSSCNSLPSPVMSLPIPFRKLPTPPKSRKASSSPKTSKATPPLPPPPPTFTCDVCHRPYTLALIIDIDPLSRPMQTQFHPRLHPDRVKGRGGSLHARWRNAYVDANLRCEASDSNQCCPHIAHQRLEYAQAREDRLVGAAERYGASVPYQAQFQPGVNMLPTAAAGEERGLQFQHRNVLSSAAYQIELVAQNDRTTHARLHERMLQAHVEERWDRAARETGVSVQEYLHPKRVNMHTAMDDGRIARAATTAEIKNNLASMGIA